MTGKQVMAAWLVLGLIAMNFFFTSQSHDVWGVINGSSGSHSRSSHKVAGVNKKGKHVQVPIGVR